MILLSDMNIASNRLRLYRTRAVARMSSSKVVLRDDHKKNPLRERSAKIKGQELEGRYN